jgi:hypothetical protein
LDGFLKKSTFEMSETANKEEMRWTDLECCHFWEIKNLWKDSEGLIRVGKLEVFFQSGTGGRFFIQSMNYSGWAGF